MSEVSGLSPAALRALADRIESRECTGITASWCPVHGDCTCERDEFGVALDGAWQHGRCPLHGEQSSHATPQPDHEVCPDPWAPPGGYPVVDLF